MNARCPNCRGPLTVAPDPTGRIKCPGCGAVIRVKSKSASTATPAQARPVTPKPPTVAVTGPEPADPFAFSDTPAITRPPVARRRRPGGLFWLAFALLLVGGLGAAAVGLKLIPLPGMVEAATAPTTAPPVVTEVKPQPVKAVPMPRRLLLMSVSKYLYCNRLSAGQGRSGVDLPTEIGKRLAFDWRVPQEPDNKQLVVLSDTSPDPRPMLKSVITQAVTDFCRTSRTQDRVMLYFGGHAVAIGGKAYLVPAEGDLTEPDSLIPLDEVWTKLKDCPATQKAIIFDVCRMNEDDDRVRPGGEPMTPDLEKLLLAAPPGVQVVLTCSAGQQAREYRRTPSDAVAGDVTGSLFLSGLRHVAARGKLSNNPPKPDDPLPITEWVEAIGKRMDAVCEATGKPKQTLKSAGALAGTLAASDPNAPPAERVVLPVVPKGLPAAELSKLTAAVAVPPIRERRVADDDDLTIPFPADRMKVYAVTPANTPLRSTAAEALAEVRKLWVVTTGEDATGGLRTEFTGTTNDALKQRIAREQEVPARLILVLDDRDKMLKALEGQLADEKSPYWQATIKFAQAQVKTRLAFMHEYNLLLADIRADRLPPRDTAKGETGLQLVSVAKMKSKKDAQELASAAQDLFDSITKEHAGTPWAVAAKRAKAEALGLEWRPFAPGGKPKE